MQICKKLQLLPDFLPGLSPWTPLGDFCPTKPRDWPCLFLAFSEGISLPKKFRIPPPKKNRRDRRTRGTNSWLDDTGTNFGPDVPLLFKLHEICQLILRKIIKTVATRCQILRLKCIKFDFGKLQRSPRMGLLLRGGREGEERKGGKGRGRSVERREGKERRREEGRGRERIGERRRSQKKN